MFKKNILIKLKTIANALLFTVNSDDDVIRGSLEFELERDKKWK